MSGVFDWYLISQGLGMQWDTGTIIIGYLIPIIFIIIIMAICVISDS